MPLIHYRHCRGLLTLGVLLHRLLHEWGKARLACATRMQPVIINVIEVGIFDMALTSPLSSMALITILGFSAWPQTRLARDVAVRWSALPFQVTRKTEEVALSPMVSAQQNCNCRTSYGILASGFHPVWMIFFIRYQSVEVSESCGTSLFCRPSHSLS